MQIVKTLIVAGSIALTACSWAPTQPRHYVNCNNDDGQLEDRPFVFVETPVSGDRVKSGFIVGGCSRTFESTVNWILYDRHGHMIAEGYATGGGVDGYDMYSFFVDYVVDEDQLASLIVYEVDASDGEGYFPAYNEIPLILLKD